eukprot:8747578-Lingulodinium_polyedra.AAC.1
MRLWLQAAPPWRGRAQRRPSILGLVSIEPPRAMGRSGRPEGYGGRPGAAWGLAGPGHCVARGLCS